MNKIFSRTEPVCMLIFVVLAFFPGVSGLLQQSAVDITLSVLKNITTVASVEAYAISVTVIFSLLALLFLLMKKATAIYTTVAFAAPVVAFVFGMIDSSGNYFSSMQLAYIIVVAISVVMLLRQFGVIKLKFLR